MDQTMLLTSVCPPSEGIRHKQADITAVWKGEKLGLGTILITETRVWWYDGCGMGFSLDYPSIRLHAVCRDLTEYPEEHLFVLMHLKLAESSEEDENTSGEKDDQEDENSDDEWDNVPRRHRAEIRFVPSDKTLLDSMFMALTACQVLHPYPDDSDSDCDGDEYDVEEAEQGQIDLPTIYNFEEGLSDLALEDQAALERLGSMLAESVSQQHHCLGGIGIEDTALPGCNGEQEVSAGVLGQFEEVDH